MVNEKKKKMQTMIISGIAALAMSVAFGETYTWTGKYSDIWDNAEKNWTNSVGEEVAYVNNNDAVFDDTALSFTVRFTNNAVRAANVLFDTEKVYTVTNDATYQYLYSATSIKKTGSGSLLFHPMTHILLNELGSGFFSEGGLVEFALPNSLRTFCYKPENVFSAENSTLRFANRNLFTSDMSKPLTTPVVVKNGRFVASDPGGHLMIGPLTLDNSTFDFSGLRGYTGYGIMTFSGKLTFKGSAPYELLQENILQIDANKDIRHFSLWSDPKTEFCVDDITGDGAEDVTVGIMLSEHCTASSSIQKPLYASGGLLKTGAGTLALTNAQNVFSGDIEVREGVLQVGPNLQVNANGLGTHPYRHWLGCLTNENRRIVVKEGALLYFPNRNCFGSQGIITNLCKDINVTLVFDGGMFTNYSETVTAANKSPQGFLLPNLEFSNGGTVAPGLGPRNYGRFMVKEKIAVRGTVPFLWDLSGSNLSESRKSQEALTLNGYPENDFEIEDVTGNGEVDATFGVPFMIGYGFFRADVANANHLLDDWKFGFKKTGEGTMRITAPKVQYGNGTTASKLGCRSFNGDPKVLEGTLQVDGDISLSGTVRVFAGAYLSGTGLVNNVSIEQGGGLRVRDGQTDVLRIGGGLTVGSDVKVEALLADGADVRNVRAKVLAVTGEIEGVESLVSASVYVDGVPVPNIRLKFEGRELSLRYMRGTTVVLR